MFTPIIRSTAAIAVLSFFISASASQADETNALAPTANQQTAANSRAPVNDCGKAGKDGRDGKNGTSTNGGVGGKGGKGGKGGSANCSMQHVNGQ
jgi:hypothetical protein